MKVGIIGSGIIGLSTAFLIKENHSNVEILIQSDKKNVMVTSYGAAGIFRPDPKLLPGSEYDQDQFNDFIRWCNAGREQYWKLATSWNSSNTGVYFHPTYQLSEYNEFDRPFISKLCGKTVFLDEEERDDTYCYTGKESVILGGFREHLPPVLKRPTTDDDIRVSPESTKDILQRIDSTWHGGLGNSPIVEEWTGLRPFRPSIKLEIEWYQPEITCEPLPIIHNYGHGSMGVALSWGTAIDTLKLFEDVVKSSPNIHT
ncbi:unnamed protein product [Schistosoma mattheei]|uniref:FAD dependent oxidoreductase domain-containing protein n=1 Tax=Schistosoma mattheei TaxID=31246 RepID=A0A183PI96_9TREM|nr:unnamed protein product [Schistosoma mattheei]